MSDLLPHLENKSMLFKIGMLLLLILVSFVIVNVVGLLIGVPFFGLDVLMNFDQAYDSSDQNSIRFLKYLQVLNQISGN